VSYWLCPYYVTSSYSSNLSTTTHGGAFSLCFSWVLKFTRIGTELFFFAIKKQRKVYKNWESFYIWLSYFPALLNFFSAF
jgi:hypothetical protein